MSERFYFYTSTSLTVTPSPPLLYLSIPQSQSLFVSTATTSYVSLTTPPPPTHTHTNTRQPPAPCTPNRQCSDNDGAAAIQGVWAGEREDVTWMEEKERAKRQRMEGEKERAKAERGIRGYTKGLRKTEEPRNR